MSSSKLNNKYPQRSYYLFKTIKNMGIDIIGIESFNPIIGIFSIIKNINVKYRIFSGFRAGIAGLFLSFLGFKWIYDLVEVKYKLCNDNWKGFKRIFIPLIDILEKLMIKRADIVFVAGKSVFKYAKKIRNDIILIPNGYDSSLFNPNKYNRELLRKEYEVNFPLAIYIGKLTPMYAKFLINAIKAMEIVAKEFPNSEFWIFGNGPSRNFLEKISNKNVKFKGYIEHEKVPEILIIADLGIHAYDTESLKLLEWLVMGLPIIAPKGIDYEEIVECEWEPEKIAKEVIKIFKNPHRKPRKILSWEDICKIILKVIEKLKNAK
ncbi:MAG: glycosyltransferase [Candidatus Methanomethylicaceae archaeon]